MRKIGLVLSIAWIVLAVAGYRYSVFSGASHERTDRDAQAYADAQDCRKATPGPQCDRDYADFKASSNEIYAEQTQWDRPMVTNLVLLVLVPLVLAWVLGWCLLKIVRRLKGTPRPAV